MRCRKRGLLAFNCKGLTLVELLVALVVSSIILAAVATLAYAMTTAAYATGDTAQKQAQVRFAELRVTELIKHCKLVCGTPGGDLALWRSDDNGDEQLNINELVFIEKGDGGYLKFCEFPSSDTTVISLSAVQALVPDESSCSYITLIPQCSNLGFSFDTAPPDTQFVSVSFDLEENGIVHQYQINAALRCRAQYLLDGSGEIVSSDDD